MLVGCNYVLRKDFLLKYLLVLPLQTMFYKEIPKNQFPPWSLAAISN